MSRCTASANSSCETGSPSLKRSRPHSRRFSPEGCAPSCRRGSATLRWRRAAFPPFAAAAKAQMTGSATRLTQRASADEIPPAVLEELEARNPQFLQVSRQPKFKYLIKKQDGYLRKYFRARKGEAEFRFAASFRSVEQCRQGRLCRGSGRLLADPGVGTDLPDQHRPIHVEGAVDFAGDVAGVV